MRKTIRKLEQRISDLEYGLMREKEETLRLRSMNDAYKVILSHIPTITVALEKVTDCVAHVLTDLKSFKERR